MKVLIDIDEKVYKHIKEHSGLAYAVEDYLHEVEWAIKKGTPLFEGATNGDALISLYPNLKYIIQILNGRVVTTIGVASSFDLDWWNAPYKAGEDKE